jgi:sugar/nucleoside kinase (ribokinase family)
MQILPAASRPLDLVVVGELNVDLLLSGDVTPAFGQAEKLVDDAVLTMGSSSAIFACGAARLGLRTAFMGLVGDDVFGRYLIQTLQERGIDTRGVVVDPAQRTGLTVHLTRPGGDRAMLTHLGAISAFHLAQIDLSLVAQARHLHLGSYFLHDALRADVPALYAHAREQGMTTSMDTNFDPAEQWDAGLSDVLPYVDCFFPNEVEAMAISGEGTWQAALDALAARLPLVALKRGVHGAALRMGDRLYSAGTIPVEVVDTTGAGDSFDAGFVYALLSGWPLERCLDFACVCGALSTRAAGGTTAQPTLDEALAYL